MNIEQTIKTAVRQAIMEEINGLAIRATIREKIEAAGVTDADIRELVKQTADSYFRSAMDGNVEVKIREIFDARVNETVQKEIKAVTGSFWSGRDEIRKALNEAAAQEIKNGFDISVVINPKR